jgi:D-glycero-alpha-D-manno-heptose-7-phosphate kinase
VIITQTPLRVSFAGGGTDLADYYKDHGGLVVNAAIDKSVFVILTRRNDDKIYINYSRKEIVNTVEEIKHELVREAMHLTGIECGIEVTMLSDIPSEGSGLGSSSSFTVGLLTAFHTYLGNPASASQIAEEACEIEIERCGKPIGKQDQYIAAHGGVLALGFNRNGQVSCEPISLSEAEQRQLSANLFLFYSNQTRKADPILADQIGRMEENLERLHKMQALAVEARKALIDRRFGEMGGLIDRGWKLKKDLSEKVSNEELNRMYALAMTSGATGAKVCGAGGGGFLMAYCPPPTHERLREVMKDYRWMPVGIEPDGSKVIFNYRRSTWK